MTVKFHSSTGLFDYFYTDNLQKIVNLLDQKLATQNIHIFSEALVKKNKLPTGIMLENSQRPAFLLPFLLRDPGCGFLLFKITQFTDKHIIKKKLHDFFIAIENNPLPSISVDEMYYAIKFGLSHLDIPNAQQHFEYSNFSPDYDALYLSEAMLKDLAAELPQVSNSIEIKYTDNPDEELLGMIHSGSDLFPELILDYWYDTAVEKSLAYKFTTDEITDGLLVLDFYSEEGQQFAHWQWAAMNYCLYKRYFIYQQIKSFLEDNQLATVELLNDHCHAGLFVDNSAKIYQSRGVQFFKHYADKPQLNNYILAGQRESISYLVQPNKDEKNVKFLGHGTSYSQSENIDYAKYLDDNKTVLLNELNNLVANTPIDPQQFLAFNYNIMQQMEYLTEENYFSKSQMLFPLLNYQSPYLRAL